MSPNLHFLAPVSVALLVLTNPLAAEEQPGPRTYENRLTPLADPKPLLADHPEALQPTQGAHQLESPRRPAHPGGGQPVFEIPPRQGGPGHVQPAGRRAPHPQEAVPLLHGPAERGRPASRRQGTQGQTERLFLPRPAGPSPPD